MCLFVTHFFKTIKERENLFKDIESRLQSKGIFINAEISADFESSSFPDLMKNWLSMKQDIKATESDLKTAIKAMKENLGVISPREAKKALVDSGFKKPVAFFQSILIQAWYVQKT